MPRYDDQYSSTRLYVGHLSSRTRTRDLEDIFNRYGRVRDVDMKRDYAFVEFSNPRDADDARYALNGRDFDGSRIIVEFAKGAPRGPGGSRDFGGKGPPPGSGRCFNCGIDGHWARDCKAGDWKNKCYRCGERGHIERNCQNSPKKLRHGRSYSRSPSRHRSPSFSRSRSYSRSRSPPKRERSIGYDDRSRSPCSRSPKQQKASPVTSRGRKHSLSPDCRSPCMGRSLSPDNRSQRRGHSLSPKEGDRKANGPGSPRAKSRSPADDGDVESPGRSPFENGGSGGRSPTPVARDGRRVDDEDDYQASPRGSD